ncbi:MAG: hypothetical protein AAF960_00185 [Bacteroidota bacterium]
MDVLLQKSVLIFIGVIITIALLAVFPSPSSIGLALLVSAGLVGYQAVIILRDGQ